MASPGIFRPSENESHSKLWNRAMGDVVGAVFDLLVCIFNFPITDIFRVYSTAEVLGIFTITVGNSNSFRSCDFSNFKYSGVPFNSQLTKLDIFFSAFGTLGEGRF